MENQFKNKYLKYKSKYLKLREQIGGVRYQVNSGTEAPISGCYVYLAHPEGKPLSVQDGMPINKWYYDWYGEENKITCDNDRKGKYQSDYKPEYGTLIVNVEKGKLLPHLPDVNNIPKKPGCYVYLAHPDGKPLSVQDGMPINKWYYDWYGEENKITCDNDRKGKYQSDYKPDYGTLIVNVEKYNKETGLINPDILFAIHIIVLRDVIKPIDFNNLPAEFNTPELKSAIVWGALNRKNLINDIPAADRLRYITNNTIMREKETNRDRACRFVKYYDNFSQLENLSTIKKLLGL